MAGLLRAIEQARTPVRLVASRAADRRPSAAGCRQPMWVHLGFRRGASFGAALVAALGLLVGASTSAGDLGSRARSLKRGIGADTARVETYRGRIRDLETRLAGIESSLGINARCCCASPTSSAWRAIA